MPLRGCQRGLSAVDGGEDPQPLVADGDECSQWAARVPSAVTTVQSSESTVVSVVPSVTIGWMTP